MLKHITEFKATSKHMFGASLFESLAGLRNQAKHFILSSHPIKNVEIHQKLYMKVQATKSN
jgi:hypothetical protein